MTSTIGRQGDARRRRGTSGAVAAALRHALGWPVRVYRARRTMAQLSGLNDHELRDIGLSRQDLRDATALAFDADPSIDLRRRREQRRRRCRSEAPASDGPG